MPQHSDTVFAGLLMNDKNHSPVVAYALATSALLLAALLMCLCLLCCAKWYEYVVKICCLIYCVCS